MQRKVNLESWPSRVFLRKIGVYSVVGFAITVLHFVISIFLTIGFGVSVGPANVFAYLFCNVVSFMLNAYVTFKRPITKIVVTRQLITSFIMPWTIVLIGYCVELLGLSEIVSQAIAQAVISLLIFVANDKYIFSEKGT